MGQPGARAAGIILSSPAQAVVEGGAAAVIGRQQGRLEQPGQRVVVVPLRIPSPSDVVEPRSHPLSAAVDDRCRDRYWLDPDAVAAADERASASEPAP